MRVGDLFSGIGGFSLAAHWLGWETAYFSEVDPYASRLLAKNFPGIPNLGDIRAVRWESQPPVDILCGGFPCQPHSVAGKKLASQDERDLSGEVIRAIAAVRPRYAVLENVPGLLRSEGGEFFRRFLRSLAQIGYDAEWVTLSASDMGAPHRRDRLWIVAYPHRESQPLVFDGGGAEGGGEVAPAGPVDPLDADRGGSSAWAPDVADALRTGLEGHPRHGDDGSQSGWEPEKPDRSAGEAGLPGGGHSIQGWDAEPAVGIAADGLSRLLDGPFYWDDGWEDGIPRVAHGIANRVDQLRGLGNAIVPHCAAFIFAHIARHAALTSPQPATQP